MVNLYDLYGPLGSDNVMNIGTGSQIISTPENSNETRNLASNTRMTSLNFNIFFFKDSESQFVWIAAK